MGCVGQDDRENIALKLGAKDEAGYLTVPLLSAPDPHIQIAIHNFRQRRTGLRRTPSTIHASRTNGWTADNADYADRKNIMLP